MLDSLRSFFEPDLESDIFHGFFSLLVLTSVVEKTWKREGENIVERDLWRDLTEKENKTHHLSLQLQCRRQFFHFGCENSCVNWLQ